MLSNSASFTNLPKELTIRVLHFCTYQDILRFSVTCKAYLELVLNTANLQLQIELEVNCLQISSGYMRESQQELLQQLRSYNNNWLNSFLDVGPSAKIAHHQRERMIGKLCSGLFTNVYSRSAAMQDRMQADTVEIIPLDEPTSRWIHAFDVTFRQIAIDPNQDLLILAAADEEEQKRLTVHFYSLRTGLAHPCARHPVIVLELEFSIAPFNRFYSSICLSILEELLAVDLVSSFLSSRIISCDALVLDWRNGCLLNHIGSRHGFCSTICLNKDQLAVFVAQSSVEVSNSRTQSPKFDLITLLLFDQIRIPRSERLPEGSNVFDVSKGSILAPALALEFPKLGPDTTVTAARFRAHSSGASTSTQKFIPSSLGQTLCLTIRTLRLIHFPAPRANYVIFLDLRRILHHLPQDLSQAQANSLPWSAWGEAATRWNRISDHEPAYPLSKTHGSRYVMARRVEDDGPFTELVVADFNPVLARRSKMYNMDQKRLYLPEENCDATTSGEWPYLKSNPGTKIVVDYVDESRPTVTDGISDNPIVSRLPYRVTVVSGPAVAFDDWMIDGNRLIGIKDGSLQGLSFDQFEVHYIRD